MKIEANLENLSSVALEILSFLDNSDVSILLLKGDLSSGKTTLTAEIAKILNISDKVTSPTFSIQNIYRGEKNIYHYDIYQKDKKYLLDMGMLDMLSEEGLHVIEWGDESLCEMLNKCGFNAHLLEISHKDTSRIYSIKETI